MVILALVALVVVTWGTGSEMYFSSDKNGESRVTRIQEGDEIWVVVYDPDEDQDCDVRDKVWTDIKVMDAKTGAHIVWRSYKDENGADTDSDGEGDKKFNVSGYAPHKGHWPGPMSGWLGGDYLEETNSGTGLFVSSRPFQIGTRIAYTNDGRDHAHIVGPYAGSATPGASVTPSDFEWGGYLYADSDSDNRGDDRVWVGRAGEFIAATTTTPAPTRESIAYLPPGVDTTSGTAYMFGRFENMDTISGLYVDPDDPSDVALALAKIIDTEATVTWNREVYPDGNEAATITIVDPDENLHCGKAERVPVFVLVNPGSWNPASNTTAYDFCSLKRYGGMISKNGDYGNASEAVVKSQAIVWHNIYHSFDVGNNKDAWINLSADGSRQPNEPGTYYIDYPVATDTNVTSFDTASQSGITRVMFYAVETGRDTGTFELRLNSILRDLGFDSLNVRDVLVAYYLDPNDQDDFKLATAYIHKKTPSLVRFTDYARKDQNLFWIGRDPVYVEVVDANANTDACCPEKVIVHVCDPHEVDDVEWLVLDELSSNSSIFFTNIGMSLVSVWDALGVGDAGANGGYSLQLDNWTLEAFNEDSIYARYNDVYYQNADIAALGDSSTASNFPPQISRVRVANDVSFAVFEVGDTQVYDGETAAMHFLDRQGNRVDGYLNSDCVFVQVIDPDQDEDQWRRERIDAFWDGSAGNGQNFPFGPLNDADNHNASCGYFDNDTHPVNDLLGDTNIFDSGTWGKLYVLNPRNGRWAPIDLLETGTGTGDFVSVTCIDLVSQYGCAPSLGVLPGDTILAAYQDPSNHSDMAWTSIKVGIGGAYPAEAATTLSFIDAEGNDVNAYLEGEPILVKVFDPSLAGVGTIDSALTVEGIEYSLAVLPGAESGTFVTEAIDLGYGAGATVTATYVDPADPADTATATIPVVASQLRVDRFYAAPSPFADDVTFAYIGDGLATAFSVSVYDLAGHRLWSGEEQDALYVSWDGRAEDGRPVANGAYIYVVVAIGHLETFTGKGMVFVNR